MSSSNQPNKSASEDPTSKSEQQQYDDIHSSTGGQGGRKLTPLPLTNPNAKPGQNQVKFEYIICLKLIIYFDLKVLIASFNFHIFILLGCCS